MLALAVAPAAKAKRYLLRVGFDDDTPTWLAHPNGFVRAQRERAAPLTRVTIPCLLREVARAPLTAAVCATR